MVSLLQRQCGFLLRVADVDPHLLGLDVTADNGDFRGTTFVYASPGTFGELAEALRGFPQRIGQRLEVTLGATKETHAGGGVRIALVCESLGRVTGHIGLRGGPRGFERPQSVALVLRLEPAALDRFVANLSAAPPEIGSSVLLAATKE